MKYAIFNDIIISMFRLAFEISFWYYQSGTKPNLLAKILATKFGSFFRDIYNALKNMFSILI